MASLSRFVLAAFLIGPMAAAALAADPPPVADKAAESDKAPPADKKDAKDKVDAAKSAATDATATPKLVCRTIRMTGSNLRQQKVCSTPDSEAGAGDWVRQQQERGGLNASGALNGRGG